MMKKTKKRQSMLTIAAIVLALMAAPVASALAQDDPTVVPPSDTVLGMTYGDWAAAWWQWVLSIPADENPVFDNTGENCAAGQSSSPVFYLVGAFTDEVPATPDINEVTRDECTVPPNKYLFFPIINVTADNTGPPSGDFFAPNEGAQRDTAALFANLFDVASLGVTVDGTAVENLGDFRAQSPSFNFTLPPKNILGVAPKRAGLYFAVTDGYWIMLEPLSSGEHIINFNGDFVVDGKVEFGLDVTYNLVVE